MNPKPSVYDALPIYQFIELMKQIELLFVTFEHFGKSLVLTEILIILSVINR